MRLQRLLRMGPAEIAFRSRQEASKAVERLAVSTAGEITRQPPPLFHHLTQSGACAGIRRLYRSGEHERAAEELLALFRAEAPSRFFAGTAEDGTANAIAAGHPAHHDRILDAADAVCRDEFSILGYGRLCFGSPVDWHLDPVSGRRSPLLHWSRIDPLDAARVGDSKVVWELNRHQWLLELGQAYCYSGDERYARVFAERVRDWMAANPPGLGINWSSALEVAMRLIAWCWALLLFRRSRWLTAELFTDMLAWLRSHAAYVERYLSRYFSPNTHLTGEALGLYYAGTLLRELEGADRWREQGRRILDEQAERQISPDGVYFEQSTRYQYYTLEIYLHYLLLASRNRREVPPLIAERCRRMLDFLLALRRPDGGIPQIGDADGGWLLPLSRRQPDDFNALFAVGACLFRRADYAWAAGDATPEVSWLFGRAGRDVFDTLQPSPPTQRHTRLFHHGGYVVMRSHWGRDAHHMIIDTGPLGCVVSGGHGHADLLAVQCSVFGEPCIVDAGTCCYRADSPWRNHFRGTGAHSTVTVDGRDQARPAGPFAWAGARPAARLHRWEATQDYELVDAEHDAYGRLEDPVTHRRRVMFVRNRYWLVVDDISGTGKHSIEVQYQLAPLQAATGNDGWVRVHGRDGHALLIRAFSAADLQRQLCSGSLDPVRGWISPDYGQRLPAPMLVFRTVSELPLRIVTMLYPVANAATAAPAVTPFMDDDLTGLAIGAEQTHTIRIRDRALILE